MADYTFAPAPVFVEETGEFAIGSTGVLRDVAGGTQQLVYDLNDLPLDFITVGPKGAHQAFKADVAHGVLDFGSVEIVAVSAEAQQAAITAEQTAEQAVADAQTALAEVQALRDQIGSGKGLIVLNEGEEPPADTVDDTVIFEVLDPVV